MDDRLNLGCEVRELKLGSTFYSQNSRTSFHTLKYDFKPASVDLSKVATLDVSSNNQVTVTVPHLDGSGVPKTVFKGNQRNYAKECVLIIDKVTGEITLERLHHNIQVKKTRSESISNNKVQPIAPPIKLQENSTQRTVSKTKVSTGLRKTPISAGFVPRHSPLQGSPSYPHHKSPQNQAPLWNVNNVQSTLPSIPMIGMDDDDDHHHPPVQTSETSQIAPQIITTNLSQPSLITTSTSMNSLIPPERSMPMDHDEIGVLSSSDSSSDSESSGSGSDSDSPANSPTKHVNGHLSSASGSLPTHLLTEDLCLSESNSDSDDSD